MEVKAVEVEGKRVGGNEGGKVEMKVGRELRSRVVEEKNGNVCGNNVLQSENMRSIPGRIDRKYDGGGKSD